MPFQHSWFSNVLNYLFLYLHKIQSCQVFFVFIFGGFYGLACFGVLSNEPKIKGENLVCCLCLFSPCKQLCSNVHLEALKVTIITWKNFRILLFTGLLHQLCLFEWYLFYTVILLLFVWCLLILSMLAGIFFFLSFILIGENFKTLNFAFVCFFSYLFQLLIFSLFIFSIILFIPLFLHHNFSPGKCRTWSLLLTISFADFYSSMLL